MIKLSPDRVRYRPAGLRNRRIDLTGNSDSARRTYSGKLRLAADCARLGRRQAIQPSQVQLALDVLSAVGAAWLVLVSQAIGSLWWLRFLALVPLMLRLHCAGARHGVRLGALFGLALAAASNPGLLLIDPVAGFWRLGLVVLVTGLFGLATAVTYSHLDGLTSARRHAVTVKKNPCW